MTPPSRITPTVGMNIGKVDQRNRVQLILWDVGGQSELQTLWDKYISECHAIVYIIDASNKERIEESQQAFSKLPNSIFYVYVCRRSLVLKCFNLLSDLVFTQFHPITVIFRISVFDLSFVIQSWYIIFQFIYFSLCIF